MYLNLSKVSKISFSVKGFLNFFFSILANSFAILQCMSSGDFSSKWSSLSRNAYFSTQTLAANSSPLKYFSDSAIASSCVYLFIISPKLFKYLYHNLCITTSVLHYSCNTFCSLSLCTFIFLFKSLYHFVKIFQLL